MGEQEEWYAKAQTEHKEDLEEYLGKYFIIFDDKKFTKTKEKSAINENKKRKRDSEEQKTSSKKQKRAKVE